MPKSKALRLPAVTSGKPGRSSRISNPTDGPVPSPAAVTGSTLPAAAAAAVTTPAVVDPQLKANYDNLVNTVVKGYRSTTVNQLEFNYDLGLAAAALESETGRNTYGAATLDQFIKDMADRTGKALSKATVYAAKRFSGCFQRDDIQQLVASNWSYRNVLFLTAEAVPPKLRNEIIREVSKKQLDQKDVEKRLRAEVKPKATRGRKPTRPAPELKRVVSSAAQFLDRLSGLGKVFTALPKVKDVEKPVVKAALSESIKGLKELRKQVDAQIKIAEKIKIT